MRTSSMILVAALALAGCVGGDGSEPEPTSTSGPGTGTGTDGPNPGTGGTGDGTSNGTDGSGPQTWYLHAEGECESGPTYYLDTEDSEGDVDGCGFLGTGTVWTLEAREPSTGGSGATGTTYLATNGGALVNVEHVLYADGVEIGRHNSGDSVAVGAYSAYAWEVTGSIPAGAVLKLDVDVVGAPGVFLGTEGDHASSFTVA